jgi:hypothetical protein
MLKKSNRSSMIKPSRLKNEKGMAIFELIPIIVVIVLFVNFSLGFFGAIHTGILNSIAARNYAFETFRNRSNLVYFRNTSAAGGRQVHYADVQFRTHAIASEKKSGTDSWYATTRVIDFMSFQKRAADQVGTSAGEHNKNVRDLKDSRNETVGVNPIWLRSVYGMCLSALCTATGS